MKVKELIIVIVFFCILGTPMVVGVYNFGAKKPVNMELKGFSDSIEKPQFKFNDFFTGQFQKDYVSWYDGNMPLKGFWVRNYGTLKYHLFNEANNPIGKNKYIYDDNYLSAELAIEEEDDYTSAEKQNEMKSFVDKIEVLNGLLEKNDKEMLVYVVPSKARMEADRIPYAYSLFTDENKKNSSDVFLEEMSKRNIDYIYCGDYTDQIDSPLYYSTGIHWSRPYEQYSSQLIIDRMAILTGKNYRQFDITGIETSKDDYYRDNDLYEMINTWTPSGCDYYQYTTQARDVENTDKIRMFIYGDSFALGLRKDILEHYPNEAIYYVNRDDYIYDSHENFINLKKDYNNLDVEKCLTNSDIVVLEFVDAELKKYSYGFVDYLVDYLNNGYEEKDYYNDNLDMSVEGWNTENIYGLYGKEDGYAWTSDSFEVVLENEEIFDKGLNVSFAVPNRSADNNLVTIYVNGKKVFEKIYTSPEIENINVAASDINNKSEGKVTVYGMCTKTFCPKELGMSEDERNLGIQLLYIGEQ